MSDYPTSHLPPQTPEELEPAKVEWLYGTLDETSPDAGRGRRFPFWTCLTFLAGCLVVAAVLLLLLGPTIPAPAVAEPTPLATPTPDAAATALAQLPPTPTATPAPPTPTPTPTPTPFGKFNIGDRVTIAGTGSRGLRLRSGPGLNYPTIRLAKDGEIFFVMPGTGQELVYPMASNGFLWWRLRSPAGEEGWTVENYLKPAPLITPTPTPTPKATQP